MWVGLVSELVWEDHEMAQRYALADKQFLGVIVGIVLGISSAAHAQSVTYTYDDVGRLKSATYPSQAVVDYALDAAGNRKTVTATGGTALAPATPESDPEGSNVIQVAEK